MYKAAHFWLVSGLLLLSTINTVEAQIDLRNLRTQSVKQNQPWAQIETRIIDIAAEVEIDHGVITSRVTIEYMPETTSYTIREDCTDIMCEDASGKICKRTCTTKTVQTKMDSLETTAYFQLPDNTVITDMYLWVGDEKVNADLQDRALASAQYESIVQRRLDPALIETWGNGSYSLRIFPNESGVSRKIQIEFVTGMETQNGVLQGTLPFRLSPSNANPNEKGLNKPQSNSTPFSIKVTTSEGRL